MDGVQILLGLTCLLVSLIAYVAPAAWAVSDAQKRGKSGALIAVLCLLFGPLSALVWLLVRPARTDLDRVPDDYNTADDALAGAARLDQLGEWDAAIALYASAAQRWPEQQDYIAACVKEIEEKQALG